MHSPNAYSLEASWEVASISIVSLPYHSIATQGHNYYLTSPPSAHYGFPIDGYSTLLKLQFSLRSRLILYFFSNRLVPVILSEGILKSPSAMNSLGSLSLIYLPPCSSFLRWYHLGALTLLLIFNSPLPKGVAPVDSSSTSSFLSSRRLRSPNFYSFPPNHCRICQPRFEDEFYVQTSIEALRPEKSLT